MKDFPSYCIIQVKLVLAVLTLGSITFISLSSIDTLLSSHLSGYRSSGSLFLPMAIFFPVAYTVIYFGYKYGWKSMLPYHFCAIAVFFPLIFGTAVVDMYIGLHREDYLFYSLELCQNHSSKMLCGQALAHQVFCMTARALPLMIIIPSAFSFMLKINFLRLRASYEASR
jgi:hypothetical protein